MIRRVATKYHVRYLLRNSSLVKADITINMRRMKSVGKLITAVVII